MGAFPAGNAGNVIVHSTIRTTTAEDRAMVLHNFRRLVVTQADVFGCTFEIREGVPEAPTVLSAMPTAGWSTIPNLFSIRIV